MNLEIRRGHHYHVFPEINIVGTLTMRIFHKANNLTLCVFSIK